MSQSPAPAATSDAGAHVAGHSGDDAAHAGPSGAKRQPPFPTQHPLTVYHVQTPEQPNSSVHRWLVHNIPSLNRRNKITSHPFWVPSESTPRFRFRLVVVRGAVPAPREEDDAVGVFLEYVPGDEASGTAGAPPPTSEGPELVKATCVCINMDNPKESISAVESALVGGADRVVAFRRLLPGASVAEPRFVLDGRLLLEVRLQTNVPVTVTDAPLAAVSRATDRIATSFWGGAASALSALSSLKTQAAQLVQEGIQQAAVSASAAAAAAGGAGGSSAFDGREDAAPALPWDCPPLPKWRGREAQWRSLLCAQLPEDENVFLAGPERGLTPDEQSILTQVGLSHRAVLQCASFFDFDRDVHAGLLSGPEGAPLRRQRYVLVPGRVSDELFWAHYFWRVAALGGCANEGQVRVLLSILNAPLPLAPQQRQPRRDGAGTADGSAAGGGGGGDSAGPAAGAAAVLTTAGGAKMSPVATRPQQGRRLSEAGTSGGDGGGADADGGAAGDATFAGAGGGRGVAAVAAEAREAAALLAEIVKEAEAEAEAEAAAATSNGGNGGSGGDDGASGAMALAAAQSCERLLSELRALGARPSSAVQGTPQSAAWDERDAAVALVEAALADAKTAAAAAAKKAAGEQRKAAAAAAAAAVQSTPKATPPAPPLEPASPSSPPAPVASAAPVAAAAVSAASPDPFGDLPTIDEMATPVAHGATTGGVTPQPSTAANVTGASTGVKSTGSDFALMPWEEE